MKTTTFALLAALGLTGGLTGAFTGCKSKGGGDLRARASELSPAPAAGSAAAARAEDGTRKGVEAKHVDTRKVIRTGRIDLTVASYDEARAQLDAMVLSAGGYIDSTLVDRHGTTNSAVIVIRIPADAFTGVLPGLRQLGDITNETTSAADITDQFVDTEAQLASAQQLEKRLLELATAKNGTLDQVLTVERELARVRGEIESYQGHLKQWGDQVSLSTLTITMSTRSAPVAVAVVVAPTLGSKTSESFHSSIGALRDLAAWLLINGVALVPWLLFLVPAGLGIQRWARRHRRIPVAIVNPPAQS
ncbi:MAG: DUF4349 domain-containing protein [Kofleriaceae bacterium]